MSSNKYYDEWDEPREAFLLRDVAYLMVKSRDWVPDQTYWAIAGETVQIVGQMTEDTREMYGGKRLHNMRYKDGGALIEHLVDFLFIS